MTACFGPFTIWFMFSNHEAANIARALVSALDAATKLADAHTVLAKAKLGEQEFRNETGPSNMANLSSGAKPVEYEVSAYRDEDGAVRHRCGRRMEECLQPNGQYWCEITAEPYYGNYNG